MYLSFFGLKHAPFSIAPDPRYLYMSERHREALAHLLYGVQAGGGFVLLTGEIGAGKTTVCRCFLEQVPAGCQVGYIVNPKLSVGELLQTIAEEFGIAVPDPAVATVKTWVDALNRHLLDAHARGAQCLLIIDEAQHLAADVLEQLRLLTNLETHERKLLQIVLIGQPELRDMVAAPGMEQLAQRVIARDHLQALDEAGTAAYVAHRLAVAGLAGPGPFGPRVLRRVHGLTGGVPRRINLLCDRALLGAYAEGRPAVDLRILERAAREAFGGRASGAAAAPGAGRVALLAAAAAGLGVAAALLWPRAATLQAAGGAAVAASARPAVAVASAASASVVPAVDAAAAAPAPAAAPASAASAVAAPAAAPAFDAGRDWSALAGDESAALRELAGAWGVALPTGGGCGQAPVLGLACWRHRAGSLPLLRQLDRPVVLALADGAGRTAHARLVALGTAHAVLASGTRRWTLPTAELAALWRGELLTLWRLPERVDPALAGASAGLGPGASGPAVAALQRALDRVAPRPAAADAVPGVAGLAVDYDAGLRGRVAAFQLSVGLNPDGLTGPTTLMQLMRALADDEPRLARE
ncbi:MAG TPA: AAA family ATPase [Aquabacterium sp.]|nr:AAA family ATPase [Aquabacterium sp.]